MNTAELATINWKTTLAGLGALIGAAALGYGMSTGVVPVNAQTIATTGGLAAAGLGNVLGKDAGSKASAAVTTVTEQAQTVVPSAITMADQLHAMKKDANDAQGKIDQYNAITMMLAQIAAPAPQPPPDNTIIHQNA